MKINHKNRLSMIIFTFFMVFIGIQNVFAETVNTCTGFWGKDMLSLISDIYHTIQLLMVVALVIFGILDFIQALSGEKDDALKKAGSKFLKRSIIVMVIVLLPLLISFLLKIFWPGLATCVENI